MCGREIAVVVDVFARHRQAEDVLVAEHLRLARLGQHQEFVAEVAADRPGLGAHRYRRQAHAVERAQIGDEHPVVRTPRARLVDIERVGVLHQEFAPAHDAETRPHLVPELPLDVVEVHRQRAIRRDVGAEDVGDHFLVGRPVEQIALVPVGDAQHLLAVGVVAPALPPQVGGLQCRHQDFDGAGAVLLLAHDLSHLGEDAGAERQPGINSGRLLAHQAGAQHQPVGDDFCLFRRLSEDGEKVPGKPHLLHRAARNSRQ